MRNAKANIGSLSSMASKVRLEKSSASAKAKAAKTPLSGTREFSKPRKQADPVQDSDSDSDSSSSSGGSSSGSDIDAARKKYVASTAAKKAKVNGTKPSANATTTATATAIATPAKPVINGINGSTPPSAQKPSDENENESIPNSQSGSESEAESTSETSDSTRPSGGHKPAAASASSKNNKESSSDTTSSSDTSSDSDDADADAKNTTTSTATAVNGKPSADRESEESSSDDSDENEDKASSSDEEEESAATSQAIANKAAESVVPNTQELSSEENDSGSESDDEGDGGATAAARPNSKEIATRSTSALSQAAWLNGSDFTLRKASSNNPGKEVADFFSTANLEGKQLWYFTAPASLPITVLKDMEIDLANAAKGGSLLTHNGDSYGLDLEPYATNTQIQLLIPSHSGDKYSSLNHNIDSTIHLRRMAKFGPSGEVHATATDDYVPVPKPIRQQPEGLRIRYTPIGVPSPKVLDAAPTEPARSNHSGPQANPNFRAPSPVTSEDELSNNSDVDMMTPPASSAPTSREKMEKHTGKPTKPDKVNGQRKRKNTSDANGVPKRLKADPPAETPPRTQKQSPVPVPGPITTPKPTSTPAKKPSTQSKEKKSKAKEKEKTPKSAVMAPVAVKRTPIPLPTYPGMKH
ncbi:DNA-directed RNA polymerase I subunit RPA34.5-domain-containing protein [Nemania sp. FL0916]|nr:DNA-directed RNA polymerase I subunit RPA34.5-domain-containing protein [Nemania sp. FL0916]